MSSENPRLGIKSLQSLCLRTNKQVKFDILFPAPMSLYSIYWVFDSVEETPVSIQTNNWCFMPRVYEPLNPPRSIRHEPRQPLPLHKQTSLIYHFTCLWSPKARHLVLDAVEVPEFRSQSCSLKGNLVHFRTATSIKEDPSSAWINKVLAFLSSEARNNGIDFK